MPATKLGMVQQPAAQATSGVRFVMQPSVQLLDAGDVPFPDEGVTITASKGSGSGTIGGTLTALTDANGLATFANLQFTGSGAHTAAFASSGLTGVTSGTVTVLATSASPGIRIFSFLLRSWRKWR